jgi:hypothetical protein
MDIQRNSYRKMKKSQLFIVILRKNTSVYRVKQLKHIVNSVVWSLLALYLVVMLVTHIPICQTYIGEKVSTLLEEKLGTHVKVGRVDLGFLNRVIIDDILIHDQQQKPMLGISRLSVRMDILPLTQGKISISSAQLFGAHARLNRRDSLSQLNFQFVLDSLASKDTTSQTPLDLRINSLIVRRSSVKYDQLDAPYTAGQFNPKHLNAIQISGYLLLNTLTDDTLDLNVKRLSLVEKSGLDINKLAFRLKAGKQVASLRDFCLEMPSTLLQADSIDACYQIGDDGLITSSLALKGKIQDSYITPSDLRSFYLPLKNIQKTISIESAFEKANQQIMVPLLHLSTEAGDINLLASGSIDQSHQRPAWHAKIDDLTLSESVIDFLQKHIPQIPKELTSIGNLQMKGLINEEADGAMKMNAALLTDIGNLKTDFQIKADKQFHGHVETEGIDLHELLDNEQLGLLATSVELDGLLTKQPVINVQGLVSRFDYNDYPFSNIGLNGSYSPNSISGFLKIEDPNLAVELEGMVKDLHGKGAHQIALHGKVSHLVPSGLKLTDLWPNTVFAGNIDADFSAKTLNDAEGTLRISRFSMTPHNATPYLLDNLFISSGFDEQLHYVTLVSDFAKADLRGDFEYRTLANSFINFIGSALPTLPGLPAVSGKANNNFTLHLDIYKTDWLQAFLNTDLQIRQPMTLSAWVNDYRQTINLEGQMPDFTYEGARYTNGSINITTPGDTINCQLSIDKLLEDNGKFSIDLKAKASDNNLSSSLKWDNLQNDENISGNLNFVTTLYKNLASKPEAHISVQPSHIILNGTTWAVEPSNVIYSDQNILVNHFMIHNGLQHIIVNGKASDSANDSLMVDLNEVEVDYILDLVDFHSVEFSGEASGTATIKSLFGDFDAHAKLVVDDFKFEKGRMGTLYADVNWNQEAKQIDINAVANDGIDAKTYIKGYVSPTYNAIDLNIRAAGTYMDFMHNFTHSFLSSITGHVNGAVRLAGPLDEINLTGQLVVDGEATVTPLNTTYTLRQDTVVFVPDDIQLKQMSIYDKEGHQGTLSGGIHHKHLTRLTYDLFVTADNLLSYDFKDFGESTFYGTVYTSGDVSIKGRPGEVVIDCNVTPLKNSVFVYNASSPDAISNQEFIQWGSASETSTLPPLTSNLSPVSDVPTDIYINFLINCTPDATLRLLMDANTNDYITLNGDGTIRATFHNKGSFNMFGTYTVDHGTYGVTIQNIIKKNFTFNPGGTIIFGGDPYNAALNLQAVYTVNGVSLSDLNIGNSFASNTIRVNCLMNIGGQPNAPQVDFDLEMPTVNADEQQMVRSVINGQQEMNQQVLYLLGIGRFYNQGQNNAGSEQTGQTSLAMQSFLSGTLSTQINSLLNSVIKNDNWNFGANISTGNEGWHNAEYEGLISGRMLNNRLLLNGQFGYRDNATQANPSFIGDFDIQYQLLPNGNLALKVYNQTNDRYFTKSSLNTQGIGLIMKKDFNGLRDLFSTKKKKKRKSQK